MLSHDTVQSPPPNVRAPLDLVARLDALTGHRLGACELLIDSGRPGLACRLMDLPPLHERGAWMRWSAVVRDVRAELHVDPAARGMGACLLAVDPLAAAMALLAGDLVAAEWERSESC